jgi:glucose/arabinose dehydrogenase
LGSTVNYYPIISMNVLASKLSLKGPVINDPKLQAEVVFNGLKRPTSIAFLGPNDILVLEKDKGTVQRIVNGRILPEPLLDVNVANANERGMLGIAIAKNLAGHTTYVFLYFTESKKKDGTDDCPDPVHCKPKNEPLGNRLYRYELIDNKLVNSKLLLDLTATPGPGHNGGAIMIGPDNNIYIPIGDVRASNPQKEKSPQDGRSGILRITQDGKPVGNGILGNKYPLNLYYAYGLRNSFGIDFDPVTGKLWDTEDGPGFGDEINLVNRGFNSGWSTVQGMWKRDLGPSEGVTGNPNGLEDFGGKAKFSLPEFVWTQPVGVTAIKFLDSNKLGKQYENDMFVGDFHNGYLYHFDLNKKRTGLSLDKGEEGPLQDKIANSIEELRKVIFGRGFGGITDIEVGPYDGYLYVVSIGYGTIYRIVPSSTMLSD